MKELGRLITAMVTPFKDDGSIDFDQTRLLAKALVASGSDGIVVAGTTGESPTVTWEEEHELFMAVRAAVGGSARVIAGTGSNSTAEAVENTIKAEKLGVDAALLVVPYYNKPTQEGLYRHFKAVADATTLPIILYNVPGRTVTSLSADTTIRLSKIPNIVGTKEASGNLGEIARIIDETQKVRPDFTVWSGNDSDILPMMAIGAHGVISVASHLVGTQIKQMMESFVAGDIVQAAAIHRRLTPVFNNLFVVANPIPVKYALNHIGFRVGGLRLPLTEADDKTAAIIRDTLAGIHIDLPRYDR
ncbi:4-hydroxy-tetrahydrodipicolinate synthase [Dehalogenimonas sp. THU2]|uniref:4-hydroxy-tetrahydrodipicolinate synthase n=1 Tax=Dehalogenimonas sp. THU2 TaxID=3151121 RepID=UPI0032185DC6